MPEIGSYILSPTRLIPNSPYPLIHYPKYFSDEKSHDAASIHELFASNGWQTQWIYRYGPTQPSHYHSAAHECMAVLSGSATIRFGVADTQADPESNTHGDGKEVGGIELQANAGDIFLIPAGVSHKTFDPQPAGTFALLTPGGGHGIAGTDAREVLAGVDLSGFTMLGAYPQKSEWDFSEGGDHVGEFEKVWSVPKPRLDPVVGQGKEGIYTMSSTAQDQLASTTTSGLTKFGAVTVVNMSLALYKDTQFTKMFGTISPRPLPPASYALLALRDSVTIFASFNLPPKLAPVIPESVEDHFSRLSVAQFTTPALVQIFNTPLHLLGLDLYNRNCMTPVWDRWRKVRLDWPATCLARMCRVLPAFGVGGVVNNKMRASMMSEFDHARTANIDHNF